jgi:hypothetical protein
MIEKAKTPRRLLGMAKDNVASSIDQWVEITTPYPIVTDYIQIYAGK